MYYVKSIKRYNELCQRFKETGEKQANNYYLQLDCHDNIQWGSSPTPLTQLELAMVLAMCPESEYLDISTGGFSS